MKSYSHLMGKRVGQLRPIIRQMKLAELVDITASIAAYNSPLSYQLCAKNELVKRLRGSQEVLAGKAVTEVKVRPKSLTIAPRLPADGMVKMDPETWKAMGIVKAQP